MLGRTERIDPCKDRMPPRGVLHSTGGMERNEKLAIRPQLFVYLERLSSNLLIALLRFVRVYNSRNCGTEKRQTLTTEVTHSNARGWHNGHESIQQKVRCVRGLLLQRSSTGDVPNTVLCRVENPISQTRRNEDASQQAQ